MDGIYCIYIQKPEHEIVFILLSGQSNKAGFFFFFFNNCCQSSKTRFCNYALKRSTRKSRCAQSVVCFYLFFLIQQACWCLLNQLNKAHASLQPGHERISSLACSISLFLVTALPYPRLLFPFLCCKQLHHPGLFPMAEPATLLAPLLSTDPSHPSLGASQEVSSQNKWNIFHPNTPDSSCAEKAK